MVEPPAPPPPGASRGRKAVPHVLVGFCMAETAAEDSVRLRFAGSGCSGGGGGRTFGSRFLYLRFTGGSRGGGNTSPTFGRRIPSRPSSSASRASSLLAYTATICWNQSRSFGVSHVGFAIPAVPLPGQPPTKPTPSAWSIRHPLAHALAAIGTPQPPEAEQRHRWVVGRRVAEGVGGQRAKVEPGSGST